MTNIAPVSNTKPVRVSIFTPTHDPQYLHAAWDSFRLQDFHEWVIVYNNNAKPLGLSQVDPRVREYVSLIHPDSENHNWIGALKAECCRYCTGDVLLELDHDDLLMPTTIARVQEAFQDAAVGFVYSNTVHANIELTGSPSRFDERFGWRYREVTVNGVVLDEHISFPPTPSAVSRIWYAPNHLRAFRRTAYEACGGYNVKMRVLDDLELMCRLYDVTRFLHIDEPLYVYRYQYDAALNDGKGGLRNTFAQPEINEEIQINTFRLVDEYISKLALKWSRDNNLRAVELGGRMNAHLGFETVDITGDCDILADLNQRWPFDDGSVGVIRAFDVFEHLVDTVHTWKELHRVLAPGGYAVIQVPSTDGRGAWSDPTHKSYFNQLSFDYVTKRVKNKYVADLAGIRFQEVRPTYTTELDNEGVCWVCATLLKLNDDLRVPGEVMI